VIVIVSVPADKPAASRIVKADLPATITRSIEAGTPYSRCDAGHSNGARPRGMPEEHRQAGLRSLAGNRSTPSGAMSEKK